MPTYLSFTPEAVTAHYPQYIEDTSTSMTYACESLYNCDEVIMAFVEITSMCHHLDKNQIMSILSRRHDWQELTQAESVCFDNNIELDFDVQWDETYTLDPDGVDFVGELSCCFSRADMVSRLVTINIPLGEKTWQAILDEDERIENDVAHACWEALMMAVENLYEECR